MTFSQRTLSCCMTIFSCQIVLQSYVFIYLSAGLKILCPLQPITTACPESKLLVFFFFVGVFLYPRENHTFAFFFHSTIRYLTDTTNTSSFFSTDKYERYTPLPLLNLEYVQDKSRKINTRKCLVST